ncbi:MAG: ligase protein, partial [Berkelbacteria bacterium GW2011_GWB1_38_5]
IYALGISNVGEESAYDLAEKFGSFEALSKASLYEIDNIRDIGPIVAKSIYEWFQDKNNLNFIDRLFKAGVKIKFVKISDKKFVGLTFVFTGGLESITRDEAKKKVRDLGGEISESVSKNTSYVVMGADPGDKYDKARELSIKILSEKEFLELIQ